MAESTKNIITLIISIVGIPTAIFALMKAYIELKRVVEERKRKHSSSSTEGNMNNSSNKKTRLKVQKIKAVSTTP